MAQAGPLPREVRDLAMRLGVTSTAPASSIMLKQRGTMRDGPSSRAMRFTATEIINVTRLEFEWRAWTGPFGCISILDVLKDGEAKMEVRAFRHLRIGGVEGGAAAAKGEIMRYLAEIAWVPDAILHNSVLAWTVVDEHTLRVSAGTGDAHGAVELSLDDNGRIDRVSAKDRPRMEASGFVERPWSGRFFDYRTSRQK
jgi:hypothetical protein